MDGRSLVGVTGNRYIMLLLIILLLTFAGMFVETTVVALLMTPILLPVVQSVGVEPVHFGVLMMTVVTGGIMTPPVGIACTRHRRSWDVNRRKRPGRRYLSTSPC